MVNSGTAEVETREDQEFEVTLGYVEGSEPAWATRDLIICKESRNLP